MFFFNLQRDSIDLHRIILQLIHSTLLALGFTFTSLFLILWGHFKCWKLLLCQSLSEGSGYQHFNSLILISTSTLFACTLQLSLWTNDLLDFLYSYFGSTLKTEWRKKEGSAGIGQHVSLSMEMLNIHTDFWNSPVSELSF